MAELPGGDVRLWQELDDNRRPVESDRPVDLDRTPGGREPELSVRAPLRTSQQTVAKSLEPAHALCRLPEPLLFEPAAAHGADEGSLHALQRLLAEVVAKAERVRAGGDRLNRALLHSNCPAQPAHLERVGD